MRSVAGEHVELVERAGIEQVLDALAGEQLPLGVLTLDGAFRPCMQGLFLTFVQLIEALAEGMFGHTCPEAS